jgi:phage baseplate assembly protein V
MSINNTWESIPLRDGHVSSYDPATHTAKVVFEDRDNLVSNPFPVLLPNTLKNKDEIHLDPGEHVMCICLGNGLESGVVLGCVYDKKNPPAVGDRDTRVTTYEDGTRVSVDRKNHVVEIKDSFGSYIKFAGGNIYIIAAGNIYLNE